MTKDLTIIDYGIGNLRSVQKAFEAAGARVVRSGDPQAIASASKLVLPGVGAFGMCASRLRRLGLEEPIKQAVEAGVPLLGVCVGMQLLFESGEERGRHRGLGLLPGRIVRFDRDLAQTNGRSLKIPHVGWNRLDVQTASPLTSGLSTDAYVYFVHSYHAAPTVAGDVIATTAYGIDFPAIVGRNRVYGVQFHPEKSQHDGLRILRNFVDVPV